MSKKFKILKIDPISEHVLTEFYDDTQSGTNRIQLNVSLNATGETVSANNFSEYMSLFFPTERVYPNYLKHDMDHIISQVNVENAYVEKPKPSSK